MPIPVYINGVEGHTVVRDLFTSNYELPESSPFLSTLNPDATAVDCVVNTIGFPLVGGPAGSVSSGGGIDAAREILQAKNIPYIVAAPLLIQGSYGFQERMDAYLFVLLLISKFSFLA
jgi:magnesium chelatase subunit H